VKKAAVLFATGFEEIEALTIVDVLRRGKVQCDMVSLYGGNVVGAHAIEIKTDKDFDLVNVKDYDIIVLPGGMPGSTNLRADDRVINLVKDFNNKNKFIGAICAAPIVLEKAEVVGTRKITSYPGSLENQNAFDYKEEIVVVDGNLITSRGPATAIEFSLKLIELLIGKHQSEALREGMMVNFYNKNI